ncbi:unnamed protein product, partial [Amoebophrya sp. A120]
GTAATTPTAQASPTASGGAAIPQTSSSSSRLPTTRCFFRFKYEESQNVRVKLVGSTPQLGSWDPDLALELHTNPNYFPCWISNDPVHLPLGETVEYQYIVEEAVPKTSEHCSASPGSDAVAADGGSDPGFLASVWNSFFGSSRGREDLVPGSSTGSTCTPGGNQAVNGLREEQTRQDGNSGGSGISSTTDASRRVMCGEAGRATTSSAAAASTSSTFQHLQDRVPENNSDDSEMKVTRVRWLDAHRYTLRPSGQEMTVEDDEGWFRNFSKLLTAVEQPDAKLTGTHPLCRTSEASTEPPRSRAASSSATTAAARASSCDSAPTTDDDPARGHSPEPVFDQLDGSYHLVHMAVGNGRTQLKPLKSSALGVRTNQAGNNNMQPRNMNANKPGQQLLGFGNATSASTGSSTTLAGLHTAAGNSSTARSGIRGLHNQHSLSSSKLRGGTTSFGAGPLHRTTFGGGFSSAGSQGPSSYSLNQQSYGAAATQQFHPTSRSRYNHGSTAATQGGMLRSLQPAGSAPVIHRGNTHVNHSEDGRLSSVEGNFENEDGFDLNEGDLWNDDPILQKLKEENDDADLGPGDTVMVIAFQLPLKVTKTKEGTWAVTESKANLIPTLHQNVRAGKARFRLLCVGWPGVHIESEYEKRQVSDLLFQYDCIPVFLPREEFDNYMNFCQQILWPILHEVVRLNHSGASENGTWGSPSPNRAHSTLEDLWVSYQRINLCFADVIIRTSHHTDFFWIQDYHLLLLPQYLTRKIRKANIGLYLHTPFPSSDIFRCLAVREELLRAMLCADLIGFQFFEYVRKFFVTVKRIVGLDYQFLPSGQMAVDYHGRQVMIKVSHVMVNVHEVAQAANNLVDLKAALEADEEKRKLESKSAAAIEDGVVAGTTVASAVGNKTSSCGVAAPAKSTSAAGAGTSSTTTANIAPANTAGIVATSDRITASRSSTDEEQEQSVPDGKAVQVQQTPLAEDEWSATDSHSLSPDELTSSAPARASVEYELEDSPRCGLPERKSSVLDHCSRSSERSSIPVSENGHTLPKIAEEDVAEALSPQNDLSKSSGTASPEPLRRANTLLGNVRGNNFHVTVPNQYIAMLPSSSSASSLCSQGGSLLRDGTLM